jgi:hypothetical protein
MIMDWALKKVKQVSLLMRVPYLFGIHAMGRKLSGAK